jgi:hypothetical protein
MSDEDEPRKGRGKTETKESRQDQGQVLKSSDPHFLRYQKWLSFMKPRVVLGFEKIPRHLLPTMSQRFRGLALCFEKLQGWTVPVHLLQDMDLRNYDITLQLTLSLFHLRSRTFFGSSWMGSPVSLSDSGRDVLPDVIDINYLEIIYMFSRLTDPSCVAVVEIVVSKTDKYKKILLNQYGFVTLLPHIPLCHHSAPCAVVVVGPC